MWIKNFVQNIILFHLILHLEATNITITGSYYKRILISQNTLSGNTITETLNSRTRVECAGVCSSISECGAFYFDGQKCSALKAPNLILNGDDPSPIQVYMLNNLSDLSESTYWTHWSWWTLTCENPCNDGTRTRTRQCVPNTEARYGGINDCIGLALETEDCSANLKPECPDGYIPWKRFDYSAARCYRFNKEKLSWNDARKECERNGTLKFRDSMPQLTNRPSLAVPSNNQETEFIRNNIEGDSWIGISDKNREGTFRTVNNQALSYEKWDSGQPDNGGSSLWNTISFGNYDNRNQDCVQLRKSNGKLDDLECDELLPSVCEGKAICDDRFKKRCAGAYKVDYSTCCDDGECTEGEGSCSSDENCKDNLVCMTSGDTQCPAYNDNQLNGCCAPP